MHCEYGWYLCYVLYFPEHRDRYGRLVKADIRVVIGGAPNAHPQVARMPDDWQVPNDLQRLYQVHDGFGQLGMVGLWGYRYVLPTAHLVPWVGSSGHSPKFDAIIPYPPDKLFEIYLQDNYYLQLYYNAPQPQAHTTVGWCIKEHEVCGSNAPLFEFLDETLINDVLLV